MNIYVVILLAFSTGLSFPVLTAMQQLNFIRDRYLGVFPTSLSIVASQGLLVLLFVHQNFFAVTGAAGVGMTLGVFATMYHDKKSGGL